MNLRVRMPAASTDGLKLLLAQRADFAILDIHDLALARQQGKDVVGILPLVQRPLAAVLAQPSVRTPRGLEGKSVGVTGVPSDSAVLESIVRGAGGNPKRVREVTIGFKPCRRCWAGRWPGRPRSGTSRAWPCTPAARARTSSGWTSSAPPPTPSSSSARPAPSSTSSPQWPARPWRRWCAATSRRWTTPRARSPTSSRPTPTSTAPRCRPSSTPSPRPSSATRRASAPTAAGARPVGAVGGALRDRAAPAGRGADVRRRLPAQGLATARRRRDPRRAGHPPHEPRGQEAQARHDRPVARHVDLELLLQPRAGDRPGHLVRARQQRLGDALARNPSVRTNPGSTIPTWTPCAASSSASDSLQPTSANLLALYAPALARPTRPATLATLTIALGALAAAAAAAPRSGAPRRRSSAPWSGARSRGRPRRTCPATLRRRC